MREDAEELVKALQHMRERGMYVSWLCQDSGDQWQCSLRRQYDLPFVQTKARTVHVRRGRGPTMAAAINAAVADDFLDILG
ncbi:hypothetical protein [Sinorhizobium meliloti]|uniref:hypothetical protein n=1 Tax=Rhizobium meliloti TaxID=382 RepID=UPI0001E4AB53|nr:hypothetical protein [Sinorhizobium meliloti]AEG53136.1 hypothetical protein Sinme_1389 [Sinorhizobium meliloti AK83]MDE4591149.1 hypothetical protein [Sinorhizobium meliloti]SEI55858.1 hypothetical protein SAMN04244575_01037 [Sinorhizobium meliloti]